MEIAGLAARGVAHGPGCGAEEVVEIVLLARQPVEHPGRVVPVVELVFGRMHPAAVEGVFEVVEVVEVEIGFDDPVASRRCHAPVEVFEHIAHARGGRCATAVPDRVGGNENGARRRRSRRSPADVKSALSSLKQAVLDDKNLMPPVLKAVGALVTEGEILDTMRDVYGEHVDPGVF